MVKIAPFRTHSALDLLIISLDATLEQIFICNNNPEGLENSYSRLGDFWKGRPLSYINCEEELWPFAEGELDLIVSNLNLHMNNDLEVALGKLLGSLEPDGAFCGNHYAARTLEELRACFNIVENERSGGIGSHFYK